MNTKNRFSGRLCRSTAPAALVVLVCLTFVGCSPVQFSVGHVMVPLLENASEAAFMSDDVQTFRDAAPSNLFLLEGMIHTDPDNTDLRVTTSMLYFAYAWAFVEEQDEEYASLLYRKGRDHAYAVLAKVEGFPPMDCSFAEFEAAMPAVGDDESEAAAWAALNWAQYIALHLDSTRVMRDIPKASALMQQAAELAPEYFAGLCHVTVGSLHAFKPPMMGGDPEASQASFDRAFAIGGNSFLLSRFFYARYYAYRVMDDVLFRETLEQVIAAELPADDPYRLLNLVAQSKSRSLLEEIDELF